MSLTEDLQILGLFGDNVSLWGPPHDEETSLHLGTDSVHLKGEKGVDLDTFEPLTPESDVSGDDPMPDWMSEKVALSAWLGDEEDIPMAEMMTIPSSPVVKATPPTSSAEDLLKQLLEDIGVPANLPPGGDLGDPTVLAPGEDIVSSPIASPLPDQPSETLLALSPTSPLGSEASAFAGSSPASPEQLMADVSQQSVLGMPVEEDLEAQALALLDILSGTTGVDTSMMDTEVITINLPPPSGSLEEQSRASVLSAAQAQSLASVFSEVNSPAPFTPESSAPASPESMAPASPESKPPTPEQSPIQKRTRTKPRLKNASPIDRKSRKRTQNKEAATRYRLKKRAEAGTVSNELQGLQDTNKALKDKVEGLSKEIQYLKDLLLEVRQLKGQINTIQTD